MARQRAARPDPTNPLSGLPLAILTGIAGGVAGLTFFTFVGGAITVARLRGAGLSGTKAVALVPKADLLAVGAQALLLPALIALGVVAFYAEWAARDKQKSQRFLRLLAGGGIVAGVAFVAVPWPPWYWGVDEWEAVVAMSVVAVTGALAVDYLAKPEESRAPAAILLFLVVALFVATTSYARGYARPSVHPVAVVRADEETGISGIYVGETDDGVWIGEVKQTGLNHGDKKKGEIIELPRSQVRGVAIGSLRSLDDAVAEGPKLLDSLKSCLATPPTCKAPR